MQTYKSGPKVTVLHEKNTQMRAGTYIDLSVLVQITLFCMHKTTGNVWES